MTFENLSEAIRTYESFMYNSRDSKITKAEADHIARLFIDDIHREKVYGMEIEKKLDLIRSGRAVELVGEEKFSGVR